MGLTNNETTDKVLTQSENLADLLNTTTARVNIGLGNVENIALNTWAGSTNITTIGALSSLAIGTGSPSASLHVYAPYALTANSITTKIDGGQITNLELESSGGASTTGINLFNNSAAGTYVKLESSTNTASVDIKTANGGALRFQSGATDDLKVISYDYGSEIWSVGNMWTRSVNTGNFLTTIETNTGNFGIGTTSPLYRLDVLGDTRLNGGVLIGATETGGYITSGDHKVQILGDNATQGLMTFIGGSGLLQIWKDTSPTKAWGYGMAFPGNSIEDDLIFSRWSPNWYEAFRIQNATGYFGIGESNPTSALYIGDVSGNADIILKGDASERFIKVDDTSVGPGTYLTIRAGSSLSIGGVGGDLQLLGGDSSIGIAGNTTINGGFGTAGFGNVFISPFGGHTAIGHSAPTSMLDILGANGYEQFRMQTSYTPTSNTDSNGFIGDVAWDNGYFYIKTANDWGRIALDFIF